MGKEQRNEKMAKKPKETSSELNLKDPLVVGFRLIRSSR